MRKIHNIKSDIDVRVKDMTGDNEKVIQSNGEIKKDFGHLLTFVEAIVEALVVEGLMQV